MGLPPKEKAQFACTVIALPAVRADDVLQLRLLATPVWSDTHEVFITPIGWAFSIWGIIYTWLGIGLVYGLSQLWRRTDAGPVYLTPVTDCPPSHRSEPAVAADGLSQLWRRTDAGPVYLTPV
ncbi:hypothetical protein FJT64_007287 [Amphibalanus amphitrite]|uniref:Uncharacterized protein n=1 Tax=Amphibalanus amphitrite TaxID=1232801 RepID=A0A6A4VU54_AMPAM|nr:hypothetical protein FJT64_007287 [Amphibalanus amphitrite]